jgi:hypothetical protein
MAGSFRRSTERQPNLAPTWLARFGATRVQDLAGTEQKGVVTDLVNAAATGLAAGAGSALGAKLGQGTNPPH